MHDVLHWRPGHFVLRRPRACMAWGRAAATACARWQRNNVPNERLASCCGSTARSGAHAAATVAVSRARCDQRTASLAFRIWAHHWGSYLRLAADAERGDGGVVAQHHQRRRSRVRHPSDVGSPDSAT
eukprot:COSAG02_NODE_5885_length_3964_cov_2.401552_1_plen_128_part_00